MSSPHGKRRHSDHSSHWRRTRCHRTFTSPSCFPGICIPSPPKPVKRSITCAGANSCIGTGSSGLAPLWPGKPCWCASGETGWGGWKCICMLACTAPRRLPCSRRNAELVVQRLRWAGQGCWGSDRRWPIPNSALPTICRRVKRRGRARFWRCRDRQAVSPDTAAHAPPVAEERALPLPELPVRRLHRRGCTKGNRNRRREHDQGGGLFATTATGPGPSPQARADRVRGGKPLRQACRSHVASRALAFRAAAASGDVRRRGLGTTDYAASPFLSLLFTGPACQIRGQLRAPD